MPVLWSDPTEGQGILPAQAQFPGPAPVSPALIQSIVAQRQAQQQQAANILPQAFAALKAHMETQQRDRIANTLLASQATGQPVTLDALKTASNVGTFGFGGAPVQDYGGAQAYSAYQQQLDAQAKRQAVETHNQYLRSEVVKNLGGAGAGSGNAPLTVDPATGFIWNGRQWVKPAPGAKAAAPIGSKAVSEMGTFGLKPDDLDNLDIAKTDIIPPKGNAGQKALVVTQDGRQATVPWATWQKWASIKKEGGFNAPTQGTTGAQPQATPVGPPAGTVGTVNGQPAWWDGYGWKAGNPPAQANNG